MAEERKIAFYNSETGTKIELTAEDLKEFEECRQSTQKYAYLPAAITIPLLALYPPEAMKSFSTIKKVSLYGVLFLTYTTVTRLFSSAFCMPFVKKALQEKMQNNPVNLQAVDNPQDSSDHQIPDFSPVVDLESPPSSFSLDPGFKLYTVDEEKETSVGAKTKPLTYEELRNKSRDQYEQRFQNNTPKTEEKGLERKEDEDKWSSTSGTWPRRTNIYGDVLE